jgi:hypothetical protein
VAVIQGQRFTYSDTVNERIDISAALDILKPTDTPLLQRIGKSSLRDGPAEAVKHEWSEDDLRGQTSAVQNNPLAAGGVTLNVTGGDGVKFRVNDLLKLEDELVRVTAIATDALTITRGWAGSTDASHAQGVVVTLVAPMLPQGSDVGEARTTTKVGLFNYTQIFEEVVKVSATMQATRKNVQQNDAEAQIENHLTILGTNMEKTLLFGRKAAPAAASPGSMDGIYARLSTNVYDKAGAALTQPMLEDAMEAVWTAGGDVALIVTNMTQKRRINSFLDPYRQVDYNAGTLGTVVQRFRTDVGTVDILTDRFMPSNEVLIINPSLIGFGPLRTRQLGVTKLPPKSREYDVWQISGEYTAEVRLEKSHARIKSLATTGLF